MKRSKKQPEARGGFSDLIGGTARATGTVVLRNPLTVGGGTAFLVALFFVSANALWYQPHAHTGAFFMTRQMQSYQPPHMSPTHSIRVPQPAPERYRSVSTESPDHSTASALAAKIGDPTVMKVQTVLGDLDLYTGSIDGLLGPQTKKAVEEYQRIVGLDASGIIDDSLLRQLGTKPASEPDIPQPSVAPRRAKSEAAVSDSQANLVADPKPAAEIDTAVARVQAGLKAFGNDHIEIDGLIGEQTRGAIREFQTLFGLTVSGVADQELVAKMQEIGLIR